MADQTLTDRWLARLKNNPLIAALILIGICCSAVLAFWQQVPSEFRDWVGSWFRHRPAETTPAMGWVFAGYTDKEDPSRWASPPRITLVQASGAADRPDRFRAGDIVQPLVPVHQTIADYRTAGTLHQMDAPWTITEVIRTKEDWTGRVYRTDQRLEVMDVSVSRLPDADWAIWLRVVPIAAK